MPTEATFVLAGLLILAAGIGWAYERLGRERDNQPPAPISADYIRGLNLVLNRKTDEALELFIQMAKVDDETLETHFALGSLFRRRGEVDRAIRIHQNLIARPNLSRRHRTQALFELGEDYLKAGLLDRAENLFSELAREKAHVEPALENLLLIFEQQKDWEKAIGAARQLESVSGRYLNREIAHYYCELAEKDLEDRNWRSAGRYLRRAAAFDRDAVRVLLLNARLAEGEDDMKRALRHYQRALTIDPSKAGLVLPALERVYPASGRAEDTNDFIRALVRDNPAA